jgi:hypothetical protein
VEAEIFSVVPQENLYFKAGMCSKAFTSKGKEGGIYHSKIVCLPSGSPFMVGGSIDPLCFLPTGLCRIDDI